MTDTPSRASMAFLTQPQTDVIMLNLQVGERFERIELTQRQLVNILVDGFAIAFRTKAMT